MPGPIGTGKTTGEVAGMNLPIKEANISFNPLAYRSVQPFRRNGDRVELHAVDPLS